MLKITTQVLVLLLLVMSGPAWPKDGKSLIFVASETATNVIHAYYQFAPKAYHELGYEIELKKYPENRMYVQADFDKVDGILISNKAILEKYTNLIAVPVVLAQSDIVVYSITKDFVVEGPSSLRDYRIGLLRGYLHSHAVTEGMVRQTVDTYKTLFTLLRAGRIDVALALRRETERFLAANPEFSAVKALYPPLFSTRMYHFLNKKHHDLAARIKPVMQRLIDDKLLERLYGPYRTD